MKQQLPGDFMYVSAGDTVHSTEELMQLGDLCFKYSFTVHIKYMLIPEVTLLRVLKQLFIIKLIFVMS